MGTGTTTVTYTEISNVLTITPPKQAVTDVKYDILDSDDGFTQHLPGPTDAGEVSVTLVYDPASTELSTLQTAATPPQPVKPWKIHLGGSAYNMTFKAYLRELNVAELKPGAMQEATAVLQITKDGVTIAAGT